jgi:hypothetical protein
MKALVNYGERDIRYVDFPDPAIVEFAFLLGASRADRRRC